MATDSYLLILSSLEFDRATARSAALDALNAAIAARGEQRVFEAVEPEESYLYAGEIALADMAGLIVDQPWRWPGELRLDHRNVEDERAFRYDIEDIKTLAEDRTR